MTEEGSTATEREFSADDGVRWRVAYVQGPGVKGLIRMHQIAFRALDGIRAGEERHLSVFPGFLERAEDRDLAVALRQAQTVDPPW